MRVRCSSRFPRAYQVLSPVHSQGPMMSMSRLALAALLVLPVIAAGPGHAETATPATQEAPAPVITVVRAEARELAATTLVSGTLVAREDVSVNTEIEGLAIVEILVEQGDMVAKGQPMARLSRVALEAQRAESDARIVRAAAGIAQAEAAIAEADATRAEADATLARIRTLRATGTASIQELDSRVAAAKAAEARANSARQGLAQARAELAALEASRKELEVRMARTEIRAPEAGLVASRAARLGAIASAQSGPLFTIIAGGDIELEAEVPEVAMARISVGQPARVTPAGFSEPVTGAVRLVSPEINRTSRLGKVRVALPRRTGIRAGAFAAGQIEIERRQVVALPLSAVIASDKGAQVQVVVAGKVENRPVRTGMRADGQVEIVEGVSAGETVLLRAGGFVRAGDRITPVDAAGKPVSG